MEKNEIFKQLKELASDFGIDTSEISETSSLHSDLKMDSLASAGFLMECESYFNIFIPLGMIENISTVGDLIAAIHHEVGKTAVVEKVI